MIWRLDAHHLLIILDCLLEVIVEMLLSGTYSPYSHSTYSLPKSTTLASECVNKSLSVSPANTSQHTSSSAAPASPVTADRAARQPSTLSHTPRPRPILSPSVPCQTAPLRLTTRPGTAAGAARHGTLEGGVVVL